MNNVITEEYTKAIAEAKALGIRYEYQPLSRLKIQITEKRNSMKSGKLQYAKSYINPEVQDNILEDDYENFNIKYEPYRDLCDINIDDKIVINPRLAPRCAGVDLLLLREMIIKSSGVLTVLAVNLNSNTAVVGEFGGQSIEVPAIVVERLVTLLSYKKKSFSHKTESESYKPYKGMSNPASYRYEGDLSDLGFNEVQKEIVDNPMLTKSDKIRKLNRYPELTIANIARAVGVHYSHAYCVVDAHRKLLSSNK